MWSDQIGSATLLGGILGSGRCINSTRCALFQLTVHYFNPLCIISTHCALFQPTVDFFNPLWIVSTHCGLFQPTVDYFNPLGIILIWHPEYWTLRDSTYWLTIILSDGSSEPICLDLWNLGFFSETRSLQVSSLLSTLWSMVSGQALIQVLTKPVVQKV